MIKTNDGWTALMLAAGQGHFETVKILLNAKADVHDKNDYGSTALMHAAGHGHSEIVEMLKQAGATYWYETKLFKATVFAAIISCGIAYYF